MFGNIYLFIYGMSNPWEEVKIHHIKAISFSSEGSILCKAKLLESQGRRKRASKKINSFLSIIISCWVQYLDTSIHNTVRYCLLLAKGSNLLLASSSKFFLVSGSNLLFTNSSNQFCRSLSLTIQISVILMMRKEMSHLQNLFGGIGN